MTELQDIGSRLMELEEQLHILDDTVSGMQWACMRVLAGVLVQLPEDQAESILESALLNYDFKQIPGDDAAQGGIVEHLIGANDVLQEIIHSLGEEVRRRREGGEADRKE